MKCVLEELFDTSLVQDLVKSIKEDAKEMKGLENEVQLMGECEEELKHFNEQWRPSPERPTGGGRKWKLPHGAHPVRLFATETSDVDMSFATCMRATDDSEFDHKWIFSCTGDILINFSKLSFSFVYLYMFGFNYE
jgi:hypothetical protein